ncbi:MAG: PH domain-containing protein [Myxococcales bacterium]|nr:PH domain-containing protein [Myxococcales bacterium]MCB9650852.1 PH domain-containing protein [Deltaproteobacteria bacterium]
MAGVRMGREVDITTIERPHRKLWTYYIVSSLLAGPALPIVLLVRWFRYETLRYRFDDEGISMSWGILFRRQINLTYRRIQDIHLSSNVLERWLGLARIEIQTASGNAGAEMTIEGLLEFEALRDHLYSKMRGTTDKAASEGSSVQQELLTALHAVTEELSALRGRLDAKAEVRS